MSAAERVKPESLAIAGYSAPRLRSQSESVRLRRIGRLDKDGNVVGYTTLADTQKALLRRVEIEFDVEGRPRWVLCEKCGAKVKFGPRQSLKAPKMCRAWTGCRSPKCVTCSADVSRNTAKHGGQCLVCSGRAPLPKVFCKDCGNELSKGGRDKGAIRCIGCHIKTKKRERPCVSCGAPCKPGRAHLVGKTRCAACFRKQTARDAPPACKGCGLPLQADAIYSKTTMHMKCYHAARARKSIPTCGDCGKELSLDAMRPRNVARRNGAPPRCRSCAAMARTGTGAP